MEIHGMIPGIKESSQELPSAKKNDAQLEKACKDFESLFLNQLLTSMRKSIPKTKISMSMDGSDEGGSSGGNREEEMYEGMMDQELAKAWSSSDGIGLANVLYQQLKKSK